MSLNLSTDALRSILTLSEKRDALLSQIEKIDTELSKALGGSVISKVTTPGRKAKGGRVSTASSKVASQGKTGPKAGKRGAVKELVLAGLKEAGKAGIAVKHLAPKLAIKPQNLHVWLHTTGKKSGLVEAVGKGIYRLKQTAETAGGNSVPKPVATATTLKTSKTKRGRKRKSG